MPKIVSETEKDCLLNTRPTEKDPGQPGWLDNPVESGSAGVCPVCGEKASGHDDMRECERAYLTGRLEEDRQFREAFYVEIGEDTGINFLRDSYNELIKSLWENGYMKPAEQVYAVAGVLLPPEDIRSLIDEVTNRLADRGWEYRTGSADGTAKAARRGRSEAKAVYARQSRKEDICDSPVISAVGERVESATSKLEGYEDQGPRGQERYGVPVDNLKIDDVALRYQSWIERQLS